MNKSARACLLRRLDRRSAPLFMVTLPERSQAFNEALSDAINSLGAETSIILPPSARIEFIKPRGAPRIVAGKGARRRGIRTDPPKPVQLFKLPEGQPVPAGFWNNR